MTQSKREALVALREAVEHGTAKRQMFAEAFSERGLTSPYWNASLAYDGSLDAAKALHDSVLPGWRYGIRSHDAVEGEGFFAWITSPDYRVDCWTAGGKDSADVIAGSRSAADAATPARSWLLCILSALIAQEGE